MNFVLEPPPPPQPKSAAPFKCRFTSIRTGLPPTNHQLRTSRFPLHPTFSSRPTVTAALKLEKDKILVTQQKDPPVRIAAVVGKESVSRLKCATWEEAKRMKWVDEGYEMVVTTDNFDQSNADQTAMDLQKELACAGILVVVVVTDPDSVKWLLTDTESVPNIICFESDPGLVNKLGGSYVHSETESSVFDKIVGISQLKKTNETKEVVQTVSEAWDWHNSDDIRFCLLVIINAYIRPVPVLKNLRSKGFSTLNCIVQNCGPQILDCLMDPNCRKALQCLNKCSPVDQVCNYRCIASYESPKLEAFSLCVL
ncbi:tRNA(His) guanylyltransferase 2-like isoform X1 [Hibiscus syriacus]|uniref:tRNA(His) guanylyltransferase 2-like isoform X1 n=1 Tax=Hibiscus syriacus TaxID=106335 RepID=A0A6A3CEV9_HIBSY|nr:tRNA(His) guanylyltransferase 2-like isoform X1 [Hibiscus syriacus]